MTSETLREFDPLAASKPPPNEKPISPIKQDDGILDKPVSVTTGTPSTVSNNNESHDSHVTNSTPNSSTQPNSNTPTVTESHESHVTDSKPLPMSRDSHVTPSKQPYTGDFISLETHKPIEQTPSEPQATTTNDAILHNPLQQSHVTMTTTNQNVKSGATGSSDKIGAEISEIDSFLKSLKMGQFDVMSSSLGQIQPLPQQQAPVPQQQVPLPQQQAPLPQQQALSSEHRLPSKNLTTAKDKKDSTPIKSSGLRLIGQFGSGDSGSSSDSDSSSGSSDDEPVVIKDRVGEDAGSDSDGDTAKNGRHGYPKIKGEIDYRDLPTEECNIPFPEDGTLLPIGKVSHYAEKLVVVQALPNTPPIDEGTILWNNDKKSIAKVFETFGPVKTPLYSIKIESEDHASTLGLTVGALVYVIPGNLELTKYVFTQQLMKEKGSDASWKNDSEVPDQFKDYSDDETEQASKRKHTAKRQRAQDKGTPSAKSQAPSAHTQQQNSSHNHAPNTTSAPNPPTNIDYSYNPKMSSYFPRGTTLLSPQAIPPPIRPPQHTQPTMIPGGYGMRGQGQIYPSYPPVPPPQGMMYPGYPTFGSNSMDYYSHYFYGARGSSMQPQQQGQPQMPPTGVTMATQAPPPQQSQQPPTSS